MEVGRITSLKANLLASWQTQEGEQQVDKMCRKTFIQLSVLPQLVGFAILFFATLIWTSRWAVWTGSNGSAGGQAQEVLQLSEQTACPRATGGTCFITGCSTARGNTSCEVTIGAGRLGWHSCNCQYPTPCAHSDGRCYALAEEGWRQTLRKESEWMAAFAVAPVMRSGVSKLLTELLALDHMVGIPGTPVMINFGRLHTWDDVRLASNFKYEWQAIFVSAVKAVTFHMMQPCLFLIPYAAYSDSMGWLQYLCATVVVLQELVYLFFIGYGIYANPKWLLYPPLNNSEEMFGINPVRADAVWYLTHPAYFLAEHSRIDFASLLLFSGPIVSACAWLAIASGLVGYGVMFPSLLLGYMLAAMDLPAFICGVLYFLL